MNDAIVKRNLEMVTAVTRFLLERPHIFSQLPNDFRLVILPEDDRELSQYNLDLLAKHQAGNKPIVIARVSMHADWAKEPPDVYVPLAA
jgi:hypothetical protein